MNTAARETKVLLADDDESIRRSVSKALRVGGYVVEECPDGAAFVEGLKTGAFDVAIVDLGMPRLSGWEALEVVTRESPLTRVIVFTAQPAQGDFAAAAGASALIEKPVEMEVLLEWVDRLAKQDANERCRRLCGQSELPIVA